MPKDQSVATDTAATSFNWDAATWTYDVVQEARIQVFGSPEAVASLFRKWSNVQANMPFVEKRGYNKHLGHKYHKEEDIYTAAKPLFAANKLAYFSTTSNHQIIEGITHLDLLIVIGDGDTGAMMALPAHGAGLMRGKGDKAAAQDRAVQMAWTSGSRYFFAKNLMIDDTDNEVQESEQDDQRSKTVYQPALQPIFNEGDGDEYAIKFAWNGVWCFVRGDLARQWRESIEKSVPITVIGEEKMSPKNTPYIEVSEIAVR